jgi:magnesium chelatase subunit I
VAEQGDDAKIEWVHRSDRYHEKLATPDVTIADLIGEIDLVKHAEGRYLSDEGTMHFGMIPRSNRGIFAINELPDLARASKVGLFNVLEERDVQIRGYPIRLDLDGCLVFSANPEDYTNRGRIVTPLKDRIGSVIRTHYPRRSMRGSASPSRTRSSSATSTARTPAYTSTCRGSWPRWLRRSSASRDRART